MLSNKSKSKPFDRRRGLKDRHIFKDIILHRIFNLNYPGYLSTKTDNPRIFQSGINRSLNDTAINAVP